MTETVKALPSQLMHLQMGPSHPATHGTVRFNVDVDGETIVNFEVEIGYLHRAFEKSAEAATWTQVLPYTDRLNYVSPLMNNVGYCLAVEKLMGIKDPERSQYIRVIASEISRITDHLTCIAATAMELGGLTIFFYNIEGREMLWDLVERLTGARMTTSFTRVGGCAHDLPAGFQERYQGYRDKTLKLLGDTDRLLTKNRIFIDRMKDVGVISKEDAVKYGFTGPCLRSTGLAYDVRKWSPYLVYDRFDFDVPYGETGDNYDRYLVRMEEIRQSFKIIDQAFEQMPEGPVMVKDARVALPPKDKVYGSIEGMMNHFKIIYEGIQVPPGEAYGYTEAANGELGFYLVSQGGGHPWKCRVRPPCFTLVQGLPLMVKGSLLADIVPTFDSINMIGGEIDR